MVDFEDFKDFEVPLKGAPSPLGDIQSRVLELDSPCNKGWYVWAGMLVGVYVINCSGSGEGDSGGGC